MGAFLDKPKTDKLTDKGEGNGVRYGVSAMQGWRMEMEDAHTCQLTMPKDGPKNSSFFGVFDGHAGPKVAQFCSEHLLESIINSYGKGDEDDKIKDDKRDERDETEKAIHRGFIKLDDKMKNISQWKDSNDRSGTTAVVAVITPEHIYLGNCGDSRGILCRSGEAEFATTDHKPFNDKERSRIEKAGGTVMMQRVNGSLAVSRALGDFDYKRSSNLPATCQLVSPEPEVTKVERDPAKDHFLLLACDGIFDVMTNEEVVEYVSRQLTLKEDLREICSNLIDRCLHKNSRDNMSVILVVFPAAPKVSPEAIEEDKYKTKEAIKVIEETLQKLVEEATDPMDLEETQVLTVLQTKLQDFDVYSRKSEILETLEEGRKKKFQDQDFSGGFSDPTDAPYEFAGHQVLPEMKNFEEETPPREPTSQPVQTPTVADSDTPMDMEGITTNKTIM